MPEGSQKRKLRSDQSTSQIDKDVGNSTNDENTSLSDRNFEDISNKIEIKISKRLRDTELNQREILKLIESLASKVDNLSNVSSERGCLTDRVENSGNSADELEEVDLARDESSNRSPWLRVIGRKKRPVFLIWVFLKSLRVERPSEKNKGGRDGQKESLEMIENLSSNIYSLLEGLLGTYAWEQTTLSPRI